ATVRALFSGSWALAPGLIGLYLVSSPSMTPAYGIAALASCTCFFLYFFFAPGNGSGGPAPDPVGFFASLKRIFVPHVLS
ncbi:MFS transporter, partial [Rhizobium ruizarguesonis]